MLVNLKAIEVAGTVDRDHQLHLDEPLPLDGPSRVRVIVLMPEPAEIDEAEWLRSASSNPAFQSLHDPAEEIYDLNDGRPFADPR